MQNRTTTVNRTLALILVIMLLFNGLMPINVSADRGNTEGLKDDDDGSTGSVSSSGHFSKEWQGIRTYLIDETGDVVSIIFDITKITPYYDELTVEKSTLTKDGSSGLGYVRDDEHFYDDHFPGMPLPFGYTGGSGDNGGWPTQGKLIEGWLLGTGESGGTQLQEWLDRMDVFKLKDEAAGLKASDVFTQEGYILMIEPIVWVEQSTKGNWLGKWFYGTPTDLGSIRATATFYESATPITSSFPRAFYIVEPIPASTAITEYSSSSLPDKITRDIATGWWSTGDFQPDTEGYGIGWYQPENGGTHTWDYPQKVPEKAPDEADDEGITIVKNYVKGNEETHVETFYRGETLKQILIENEPDVDTGYELIAYYDSKKEGPTPAGTEDWASLLGTVPPILGTSTLEYDSSSENFYVEAAGGTSLGNQTVTLAEGSNTLVVKLRKMDGDFTYTDDPYIFIYL